LAKAALISAMVSVYVVSGINPVKQFTGSDHFDQLPAGQPDKERRQGNMIKINKDDEENIPAGGR
jgi:hypothetical protein